MRIAKAKRKILFQQLERFGHEAPIFLSEVRSKLLGAGIKILKEQTKESKALDTKKIVFEVDFFKIFRFKMF